MTSTLLQPWCRLPTLEKSSIPQIPIEPVSPDLPSTLPEDVNSRTQEANVVVASAPVTVYPVVQDLHGFKKDLIWETH